MEYRIVHTTEYCYASPVAGSHNLAHLLPISNGRQRCLDSDMHIDPAPRALRHFRDYFGNTASGFELAVSHTRLSLTVVSRVDVMQPPPPLDIRPWDLVRDLGAQCSDEASVLAREFTLPSPFVPEVEAIHAWARASFPAGRSLATCLRDLMARIHRDFTYQSGATSVSTPLAAAFERREGVCQDFAHIMIGALRSMGFAAGYVSGYLETRPPEGEPRQIGADASHAWVSVHAPGTGWMELDPTNNVVPGVHHIRLAQGRDYGDVAPLRGTLVGGGDHTLAVSVDVSRV